MFSLNCVVKDVLALGSDYHSINPAGNLQSILRS